MNKRIAKKIVKYSARPKTKNNTFIKRFFQFEGKVQRYTKDCRYTVFPYTKGQVFEARRYYGSFGYELPTFYYVSDSLVYGPPFGIMTKTIVNGSIGFPNKIINTRYAKQ